jgi:hypothetical protein
MNFIKKRSNVKTLKLIYEPRARKQFDVRRLERIPALNQGQFATLCRRIARPSNPSENLSKRRRAHFASLLESVRIQSSQKQRGKQVSRTRKVALISIHMLS